MPKAWEKRIVVYLNIDTLIVVVVVAIATCNFYAFIYLFEHVNIPLVSTVF